MFKQQRELYADADLLRMRLYHKSAMQPRRLCSEFQYPGARQYLFRRRDKQLPKLGRLYGRHAVQLYHKSGLYADRLYRCQRHLYMERQLRHTDAREYLHDRTDRRMSGFWRMLQHGLWQDDYLQCRILSKR